MGSYGMYDNFDDMPAGLKAAELISRIRKKGGGIDYERAEKYIGKNTKTNIQSGVMFSAIHSIEGMIKNIKLESK